ncbi:hypothetical protein H4W33_000440 [Kibdelosporangium phytohabitans]|nr:hypothetical protein [Kibdelosporangium phytohabitans]MBE1461428.1 hypothetical protein [Kibdelosporangium phytohabitans]
MADGEKPIGDAAQFEDLDAAGMQCEGKGLPVPRLLSFEYPDPYSGQCQFSAEEQAGRARSADHHIGVHSSPYFRTTFI